MDEMKTWTKTKTTIADKSNLDGTAVLLCYHQRGCPVKKILKLYCFLWRGACFKIIIIPSRGNISREAKVLKKLQITPGDN